MLYISCTKTIIIRLKERHNSIERTNGENNCFIVNNFYNKLTNEISLLMAP